MSIIIIKTFKVNSQEIKIPSYENSSLFKKNLSFFIALEKLKSNIYNALMNMVKTETFNGEFIDLSALKETETIYRQLKEKELLSLLFSDTNFAKSTSSSFLNNSEEVSASNFALYYEKHLKGHNYIVGNFDKKEIYIL